MTSTHRASRDEDRFSPGSGPVAIAGLGVTGQAVARTLLAADFSVVAWDDRFKSPDNSDLDSNVQSLVDQGLEVISADHDSGAIDQTLRTTRPQCVIASPGWRPESSLFQRAYHHGIPVWSEAELAWKLREDDHPDWVVLTGTNGKTTTVTMVEHIFAAGNVPARAVGNIGTPLIEAALDPTLEFVLVELSSFQLHFTFSLEPVASALLNLAPDHLDWHGSYEAYVADKAKIYHNTYRACIYNTADSATQELLEEADVQRGCVAVGVALDAPALGTLGVVEEHLYDRGFFTHRRTQALELAAVTDVGARPGPHMIMNALFAAGLSLGAGISPEAVASGLRSYRDSSSHNIDRGETVAVRDDVTFINNSKATNPHAARAALSSFSPQSTVWIVGGDAKGLELEDVVVGNLPRLRGAVLIGDDRSALRSIFSRHAPNLPLFEVEPRQTGGVSATDQDLRDAAGRSVMRRAVAAAQEIALPGDYVVLAPACASLDQFTSYRARGAAFREAVTREQT